ncbi:predicted protein [Histoplasma capsulatum H143]|uniref:Uncharacterized protein n=1 Tax=Ajellomyces capsulatus (strain H143) TaxID=544712 RepID=C6HF34_AJECH|nr:predicted protein [Histoplasma capsulatum H143]
MSGIQSREKLCFPANQYMRGGWSPKAERRNGGQHSGFQRPLDSPWMTQRARPGTQGTRTPPSRTMTWTPYPAATKQGRAPASLQMVMGWVFLLPKPKPKIKHKHNHKHEPLISPDHTPVPLYRVPEAGASVPKSVRPTEPWVRAKG